MSVTTLNYFSLKGFVIFFVILYTVYIIYFYSIFLDYNLVKPPTKFIVINLLLNSAALLRDLIDVVINTK